MADVWQDRAGCKEVDRSVFFSSAVTPAKAVCRGCPVRSACLDFAMADPDLRGVWGGQTEAQRDRIRTGAAAPDRHNYGRPGAPAMADVIALAAYLLGVAPSALRSHRGDRSLVAARRVAMVAAREATGASLTVVAAAFGRKDEHAVMDAEKAVQADDLLTGRARIIAARAAGLAARELAS